jgi:hypothetical protein
MSDTAFATGHCLCGGVSFSAKAAPQMTGQCHCKDCQRASGTGHMSLAFFKREDVDIKGQTASFAATADSGNINTRHFCPRCGGRVYGENSARPGMVGSRGGSDRRQLLVQGATSRLCEGPTALGRHTYGRSPVRDDAPASAQELTPIATYSSSLPSSGSMPHASRAIVQASSPGMHDRHTSGRTA